MQELDHTSIGDIKATPLFLNASPQKLPAGQSFDTFQSQLKSSRNSKDPGSRGVPRGSGVGGWGAKEGLAWVCGDGWKRGPFSLRDGLIMT